MALRNGRFEIIFERHEAFFVCRQHFPPALSAQGTFGGRFLPASLAFPAKLAYDPAVS